VTPTPLQTVDYVRAHGVSALVDRLHIIVRRHGQYQNLVHLKYNQIESPMDDPVVQECRGIVLDCDDDYRVVSFPYKKFFNHGEPHAARIDWPTARVQEKLDGSLIVLYPYRGAWHVASSGTPDASGAAHESGLSFAALFWQVWDSLGYDSTQLDRCGRKCLMFELMTPHNRVIVPHTESRIVLHGARDLTTFAELDPEPIAKQMGWECVRTFPLGSIDDCLKAAEAMNPLECEGYVVRDGEFRRIKLKCPQYVALAHMKESMTVRRLLEIIRSNESDEFLSYFPEFRAAYDRVRQRFDDLCSELYRDYDRLKDIPDQKTFAMEAGKTRFSSPLFALRAGKCKTIREFLAQCTLPAVERAVGFTNAELTESLAHS
jgi:RNA ligase-like protein